jgi:hypothetical protein
MTDVLHNLKVVFWRHIFNFCHFKNHSFKNHKNVFAVLLYHSWQNANSALQVHCVLVIAIRRVANTDILALCFVLYIEVNWNTTYLDCKSCLSPIILQLCIKPYCYQSTKEFSICDIEKHDGRTKPTFAHCMIPFRCSYMSFS